MKIKLLPLDTRVRIVDTTDANLDGKEGIIDGVDCIFVMGEGLVIYIIRLDAPITRPDWPDKYDAHVCRSVTITENCLEVI